MCIRDSPAAGVTRVSSMASGIVGSELLKIAADIRAMVQKGQKICNLTVGDFNPREFPIPAALQKGIVEAYEERIGPHLGGMLLDPAKMAVLGLMNTLVIEGEKSNIRINALGPGAATRMTEDLLQEEVKQLLTVEPVAEAMIALCHAQAPNHCILNAQAGSYSVSRLVETQGVWLPKDLQTAEDIQENWDRIADHAGEQAMKNGGEHVMKMVMLAAKGLGVA